MAQWRKKAIKCEAPYIPQVCATDAPAVDNTTKKPHFLLCDKIQVRSLDCRTDHSGTATTTVTNRTLAPPHQLRVTSRHNNRFTDVLPSMSFLRAPSLSTADGRTSGTNDCFVRGAAYIVLS